MEQTNPKDTAPGVNMDIIAGDATCNADGAGTLFGEVHKAIRVTLDELAMLAGLATADTGLAQDTHPPVHSPSAYSLLLENSLFRR